MISVQVDPVLAVNSSMRPPLPATPMPTGASWYLSDSCARTSSRLPQAGPASAPAAKATIASAVTRASFNILVLLQFPPIRCTQTMDLGARMRVRPERHSRLSAQWQELQRWCRLHGQRIGIGAVAPSPGVRTRPDMAAEQPRQVRLIAEPAGERDLRKRLVGRQH